MEQGNKSPNEWILYLVFGVLIGTSFGIMLSDILNLEEDREYKKEINDSYNLELINGVGEIILNLEKNTIRLNPNNETVGKLRIQASNKISQVMYTLSEDYRNITINGEVCKEVSCPHNHLGNSSICYYCDEKVMKGDAYFQ